MTETKKRGGQRRDDVPKRMEICFLHGRTEHAQYSHNSSGTVVNWRCMACRNETNLRTYHRKTLREAVKIGGICDTCSMVKPLSGVCDNCG